MRYQVLSKSIRERVDRNHFAFYRGYLQELDIEDLARRYLGEDVDLREAKRILAWVRKEIMRTARLQGEYGFARILGVRLPRRKNAADHNRPTLEEFREARDPHSFYNESELREMYLEDYPDEKPRNLTPRERKKLEQNARLLNHQLLAVAWAENNLVVNPAPSDHVDDWFNRDKAHSLTTARIYTLGDLMDHIHKRGYHWWKNIKGVGKTFGESIVQWLASHEETLGKIGAHALAPARKLDIASLAPPRETAIRPFEGFRLPEAMDGSQGLNRRPGHRCGIEAVNDYEAILSWLKAKATNPNTERAYRREAERLLLWAILEKGIPLSSLSVDAMTEYRDWMGALGITEQQSWRWNIPQSSWIGKRNIARWSKDWRPFDGPLSHRSREHAFTVLKSMFEWMCKVRYLDMNPLDAVARPELQLGTDEIREAELSRYLTRPQLKYALDYLFDMPTTPKTMRLRFVIPFAYATGLRRSEIVHAKLKHLSYKPKKDGVGVRWSLNVLGKGGKIRGVPIPEVVMRELRAYFDYRGLVFAPKDEEHNDEYLIGRVLDRRDEAEQKKPIDPTALYNIITGFFQEVAKDLRGKGLQEDALHFQKASTHWLRHTCGSHLSESYPASMVAELLGHASVTTTAIYTHADKERLYDAVEKELGAWAE